MKAMTHSLFLTLLCVASSLTAEVSDQATGMKFPDSVSFTYNHKDYHLQITGVSTRKKLFVKVYSVAHYLEDAANLQATDPFQEILQDNQAKQLTLKWTHDVPAERVRDGYREGFEKELSSTARGQLQSQIATFQGFYQKDVKKGDEHILRWIPGGTIEVILNGNIAGTISNAEFAKALWAIWLGEHSVVDRHALISLLH